MSKLQERLASGQFTVTGEIGGDAGSGIDPLADADALLAPDAPPEGIAGDSQRLQA